MVWLLGVRGNSVFCLILCSCSFRHACSRHLRPRSGRTDRTRDQWLYLCSLDRTESCDGSCFRHERAASRRSSRTCAEECCVDNCWERQSRRHHASSCHGI